MSVVEQKLSDVILPTRARLSKATATGFFRSLGYASYEEARRQTRALRGGGSPLYLQDRGAAERTVDDLLQHPLALLGATSGKATPAEAVFWRPICTADTFRSVDRSR